LGIANGLSSGFGMFARFLPRLAPRLIDWTFLISRPLRSTPTPESRSLTATTSRSASEHRDWYSVPSVRRLGTLPLATFRACDPDRRISARLLTFRARAADQAHAAFTPGTTWPITGHPPGPSRENSQTPRFRCHLDIPNDASTAHAHPKAREGRFLERLPGPHLTRSSAPSPYRSPRRSSANAAQGGLAPSPEGRRRRANKPPSPAQHRL
jgi:hypothetical protein